MQLNACNLKTKVKDWFWVCFTMLGLDAIANQSQSDAKQN